VKLPWRFTRHPLHHIVELTIDLCCLQLYLDDWIIEPTFAHHSFQFVLRKVFPCCLFDQLPHAFECDLFPVKAFHDGQLFPSWDINTLHDPDRTCFQGLLP